MKVIKTENNIIKSWCHSPEDGAIEQARVVADLPFVKGYVALMPDTHQGYDMPIGGVVCCHQVIVPTFVGVDIGCGMLAVKTSLTEITQEQIKKIFGGSKENQSGIRAKVPVGFNSHSKKQEHEIFETTDFQCNVLGSIDLIDLAKKQIGTLGGGNHFIEIQKGDDGYIWFMIHSGSRGFGLKIANHYIKEAKKETEKYYSKSSIGFIPEESDMWWGYINSMKMAMDFALANRKVMSDRIKEAFLDVVECTFDDEINIHHNYATIENHNGSNVWIHRKGATSAKDGELGIIPGSQGTASYIVRGKGNKESYMSCSHGSGRTMSRTRAKNELNLEEEQQILDKQGIVHNIRNIQDLDEASSAYKDIDIVMEEQKDLVDIVVKLTPLGVIKG